MSTSDNTTPPEGTRSPSNSEAPHSEVPPPPSSPEEKPPRTISTLQLPVWEWVQLPMF
jgi:hypothetical protein